MGAVVGYGSPLQGGCLEGFDFLGLHHNNSECRLARLSRLVWDQETASSNLATPTTHALLVKWYNNGFVVRG